MTPAIRLLEKSGVDFHVHRYEHAADAEAFGLEAAAKLGVAAERVFKTLIAVGDRTTFVQVLLPAPARLDLKKLATSLETKKAELADPTAAERLTGYVIGGISPLGGKKRLPTWVDVAIEEHVTVYVSAGQRGLQLELAPADLMRLTAAKTAALTSS
jgi:Cys-tRNA(Pro)/Cys-tRNA(Cys) deacylase